MTDPTVLPRGAPIVGLSHVQLTVSDVGASAAWYKAALGLEPYAEDLEIGYVALRHRAARMVFVLTARSDETQLPGLEDQPEERAPERVRGTLDHLALAVPDGDVLRAWGEHLTEVGIDHSGVRLENGNPSLQLRDPDGIAIELVAPGPTPTTLPTGLRNPNNGQPM